MGVADLVPSSCSKCALTAWGKGSDQPSGALGITESCTLAPSGNCQASSRGSRFTVSPACWWPLWRFPSSQGLPQSPAGRGVLTPSYGHGDSASGWLRHLPRPPSLEALSRQQAGRPVVRSSASQMPPESPQRVHGDSPFPASVQCRGLQLSLELSTSLPSALGHSPLAQARAPAQPSSPWPGSPLPAAIPWLACSGPSP